ncbi:competence protein, partial [Mycobacterium avium]|nr:competence protein [Mycobacterium avium]
MRLVPSALTCWAVTAGGIWWPIGRELAWCCVGLLAIAGALRWRAARRHRRPRLSS